MAETQKEKIEERKRLHDSGRFGAGAMQAMPDSPLAAVSRSLTRIIEDTVKQATLEREDMLRDIRQMDEAINKYGTAWWDTDRRLLLLPPHLLQQVPDNVLLQGIDGEKKIAKEAKESLDATETRFGVTAWGIPLEDVHPSFLPGAVAKRKHRRVRPVPAGATTADSTTSEPAAP